MVFIIHPVLSQIFGLIDYVNQLPILHPLGCCSIEYPIGFLDSFEPVVPNKADAPFSSDVDSLDMIYYDFGGFHIVFASSYDLWLFDEQRSLLSPLWLAVLVAIS